MSAPSVSIATWNIEWKASRTREAGLMRERLLACDPEIICLTEGYTDFFNGDGHLIEAENDYGYRLTRGRRKVTLWSRRSWADVDCVGDPTMPTGRFVAGRTETSIGMLTVIGVCIPWRDAHVSSGRRDRQRWQDHLAYVDGLARCLQQRRERTVIIGDFNQRIPRTHVPSHVHQALLDCLANYSVPTAGRLPPDGQGSIDHLAHTGDLRASEVRTLSNLGPGGELLSDHFGIAARLGQT